MDVANQIEKGVMPQLKADYDVIVETIGKVMGGETSVKVADYTITKENIQEIGMKFLGPEITPKVQAAMADTTGMTEVFDTPEEKKIASTLLGADFAFGLQRAPFKVQKKSFLEAINDVHNQAQKITDDQLDKQNDLMDELGISASDYWSNKTEYDFAAEYPL